MDERDALLFFENDLEVFIDGGDSYYELESNAKGTIYEVFYIWRDAYTRSGKWDSAAAGEEPEASCEGMGGDRQPRSCKGRAAFMVILYVKQALSVLMLHL